MFKILLLWVWECPSNWWLVELSVSENSKQYLLDVSPSWYHRQTTQTNVSSRSTDTFPFFKIPYWLLESVKPWIEVLYNSKISSRWYDLTEMEQNLHLNGVSKMQTPQVSGNCNFHKSIPKCYQSYLIKIIDKNIFNLLILKTNSQMVLHFDYHLSTFFNRLQSNSYLFTFCRCNPTAGFCENTFQPFISACSLFLVLWSDQTFCNCLYLALENCGKLSYWKIFWGNFETEKYLWIWLAFGS